MLAVFAGLFGTAAHATELLRDPTRPYAPRSVEQRTASGFSVNAIIVSADRRIAIINGQRVMVGSTVQGAEVTSIEKNYVVLKQGDKVVTARLRPAAAGR